MGQHTAMITSGNRNGVRQRHFSRASLGAVWSASSIQNQGSSTPSLDSVPSDSICQAGSTIMQTMPSHCASADWRECASTQWLRCLIKLCNPRTMLPESDEAQSHARASRVHIKIQLRKLPARPKLKPLASQVLYLLIAMPTQGFHCEARILAIGLCNPGEAGCPACQGEHC